MTVPISYRKGKVRVFITPQPGLVISAVKGNTIIDSDGAVKRVS